MNAPEIRPNWRFLELIWRRQYRILEINQNLTCFLVHFFYNAANSTVWRKHLFKNEKGHVSIKISWLWKKADYTTQCLTRNNDIEFRLMYLRDRWLVRLELHPLSRATARASTLRPSQLLGHHPAGEYAATSSAIYAGWFEPIIWH